MNDKVLILSLKLLLVNSKFSILFIYFLFIISAIIQDFETDVGNEYVIVGNDALFKCKIPSFVTDLVSILEWSFNYKGVSKEIPSQGNCIVARIIN